MEAIITILAFTYILTLYQCCMISHRVFKEKKIVFPVSVWLEWPYTYFYHRVIKADNQWVKSTVSDGLQYKGHLMWIDTTTSTLYCRDPDTGVWKKI